ncbi:MAG: 50S ribosomal protein L22 [Acidobacteria bacterium]|nr:MAG: 50S ribosomal protein L22 [Acidobacteriota bacterium]
MFEVKATSKYIRTSAQKAGLVLDLIRGKKASDAIAILRFTKKSVARDVEKTLRSAIANAVNVADKNQKRRLDEDDLVVSAAYADQGPSQKRVRPAPMGRAYQVIRRTTHITVSVAEGDGAGKPSRSERRAAAASSTASAAREKRTAGSKKKAAAEKADKE